jgi:nucleoside-diphosphate-sugar epimerase
LKKVLYIGGNGNISWHCTMLSLQAGHEVWHLNRGNAGRKGVPAEVHQLTGDIRNPAQIKSLIANHTFDCVVDWVCFTPDHANMDMELFQGHTEQFIFISSASAYQKPLCQFPITESTPLQNPFWPYSQDKIACENIFLTKPKDFAVTIVRPSHTYDTIIPAALGDYGYTIPARILANKPVVLHGDGTSLWTLTHSSDFAKGFVPLQANPQAYGESVHITSQEVLTWLQIYETIANALHKPLHPIYMTSSAIAKELPDYGAGLLGDKAWCGVFDISKIKQLVPDYKATTCFKDGLEQTLEWFNQSPARQKIIDHKVDDWMDSKSDK